MADSAAQPRIGRPQSRVDGRTVPERLLLAATTLFAERGFGPTTVQDIVEVAGVTKGAMYHYFSSKDDLLHEIYARILRMQMERLERVVAEPKPVEQRVAEAAADVVATTIANLEGTTIFFRSLHLLSEERQRAVRAERRRYHETFRDLIAEGQRSGVFRADVTPDLAVDYFFGSVHHLPTWYRASGRKSGEEVGATFATLFLDGLKPPV